MSAVDPWKLYIQYMYTYQFTCLVHSWWIEIITRIRIYKTVIVLVTAYALG